MEKTPEEIISEYMAKIGRRGGEALKKKGKEHFQWMAKQRWDKKKEATSPKEQ